MNGVSADILKKALNEVGLEIDVVPRPRHKPPHGTEGFDLPGIHDKLGALSASQQEKLNYYKKNLRFEDEVYLRSHPEIKCLVSDFLNSILKKKPQDLQAFVNFYFSDPKLPHKINRLVMNHQALMKMDNILRNT